MATHLSTSYDIDDKRSLDKERQFGLHQVLSADQPVGVAWTEEEEKGLVRKLDWHILPLVTVLYLMNFVDRAAVGNAKIAGLEQDLGLKGYEYNIALTVFYITYSLVEVPSNLVLYRLGAGIWIPFLVTAFGLITMCTAFIRNFPEFMVVRALLGLAEGGVMPGVSFYLSTFYKRSELVLRIAIFVSAASASGAFGGLLASGILAIDRIGYLTRWRNIFLIEGLIPAVAGLLTLIFKLLPTKSDNARWLTEREKFISVERMKLQEAADNAEKRLVNSKKAHWKIVRLGLLSINAWLCAIAFFLNNIGIQGLSLFLPSLLRGMGYSTIRSQLLSVPPYVVACAWSIFMGWLSQRTKQRYTIAAVGSVIGFTGYAILTFSLSNNARYGGIFLAALGGFPLGPLFIAWAANNSGLATERATTTGLVVSVGSLGPIVASWIYPNNWAPRYQQGNGTNMGCLMFLMLVILFKVLYIKWENSQRAKGKRDARLEGKTEDEKILLGSRHPDFRYLL